MSTSALDPLIHHPGRLRVVAILAALPDGDALSFTRLQDMLGLTPGNLIIRLRELGHAEAGRDGEYGAQAHPARGRSIVAVAAGVDRGKAGSCATGHWVIPG